MRYRFKDRQLGQIAEGYTVLQIVDFEVEVDNDDAEAILLAEKSGGELVTQQGKAPVNPEAYKAQMLEKAAKEQAEEAAKAAKADADAPLTIVTEGGTK